MPSFLCSSPKWKLFFASAVVLLSGLLLSPRAQAASLQKVNGWEGGQSFPSDVTMYVYVPDKVAAKPPVLALIHYCGGTAQAVFGQAQTGGLIKAADQYGFIVVAPSSGRCWDIVSNKTRTRNGNGDSHAIKQMVTYAIQTYSANADRVYATGDSSGGMMTELLLAVYPEIFTAGSALAGMPAGCRGANESGDGGGYSNACAGGNVTHTPQEWGDIARKMAPAHMGHRPRVQLFHGDADTTIRIANHTEAIKEWSNVLALTATPTKTDMNVPLGKHQATRQRWENACGYVALDAFTSIGGDHGPSDALFLAEYVVPFLGLDKVGLVDPEIEKCGSANPGGGAGGGGAGGGGAGGGGAGGGSSGSGGAGGGLGGSGGTSGGTGGAPGASGAAGAGTSGAGGGGAAGAAGAASGGGTGATSPAGGGTATGGGSSSAGAPASSGGPPSSGAPDDSDSGCSYARNTPEGGWGTTLLGVLLAASALVRRRRRSSL